MYVALIAYIVAALAFAVMVYFIVRHWKEIRLLDPRSIKEERQKEEREKLITRRFERVTADRLAALQRIGRTVARKTKESYKRTEERLQSFDNLYRKVKSPFSAMAPSQRERIKTLLSEARSLIRDLKWADAERRLLEVLSLDQRQLDAYKLLGTLYLRQKLYPQARETFEFLVKTRKADDSTYAGLAEIAKAEGNFQIAEAMLVKAVDASPRQPHRHAELASFYIERSAPAKAWPYAKRASELEPGSAKYLELSLETAILLGDRKEARARYNRLRLLSDDPARFQVFKDKIEAIEK
jgi:tetratricopeptide (TPR) repeat protein